MTNALVIATNVVSREISGLDVVNSVNGFYSGAFDKLFNLVLALMAFFGVILPILIQYYQKRMVRAEIAEQLANAKSQLLDEVEKKFNAEKEKINAALKENILTIEKQINKAEGGLFILQASLENDLVEKCHFHCRALESLCDSSDGGADLSNTIESLTSNLSRLTKHDLEKSGLDSRLEKLLPKIQKWNHKGLLTDLLIRFENAIRAAKKR